jgi:integrating conjugative element protein (TIGR03752 family)
VKSNGLLKWLMIPVVLLAIFVAYKWLSPAHPATSTPPNARNSLTAAELKQLGIEGDTPRDTVATLIAQVKQLRTELQTAVSDNAQQKADNERLRSRESAVDQRIQAALLSERERSRQEREQAASDQQHTQSVLQDLQERLQGLSDKSPHADLPVGLGLEEHDGDGFAEQSLRWVEPQGSPARRGKADAKGSAQTSRSELPVGFGEADSTDSASETNPRDRQVAGTSRKEVPGRPVYTLPANSTLIGSTAMTALIGRVPIDGTVNDPYPFKVLIGADNLTANGIELPDVAGAVVSGTASGDWTLSCVRGQIRSVTFVFRDGRVRTISDDSGGSNQTGNTFRDGLGWISDPFGIPCVSGIRRSNAQQYLSSQVLITAAGAGAASLIDSNSANVSYISGNNGNTLGTVGITGNEAMGRILAGGVQEMSQWINKLYGQAFAAVYVQPGARVAVHLERPLDIDYEPDGRKVNYTLGDSHAPHLD